MEEMVRKICLDSDILVALLNKDEKAKQICSSLEADFYTTSINEFELWFGRKKSETIFELFESLHLLAFGDGAARQAADMMRILKEKGIAIEIKDLFIAATCIKADVELLTFNKKHFERLKQFGLMLV